MQVTLEQIEPCKVAVTVEVDAETVQKAIDRVFQEIAGRVAVPGFRKGRAPRHIIERYVDADMVHERAISKLVPEYYGRALQEQGVEPFAQPEVNLGDLEAGQPFRFTATVPTRPEVRLCDYRDLPARRRRAEVSDADVDVELELMRRRETHLGDSDAQQAGPGLVAIVDLDLYRGERRLGKRSQADANIDMDDTRTLPAFNIAIEGAAIGETRELPVHYPADHADAVLAGKDVLYQITLKALKTKVVPELTDEFAQSAGGVETIAELRDKLRAQLEETAKEIANREVRDQLVEQAVSRSDVHFPEVLVQEQVTDTMRSQGKELEQRGLTIDDLLKAREMDFGTYERELREDARRRIRTQLVLEQIAEQEKLEVTPEDMEAEIERMAAESGIAVATMRAFLDRHEETLRSMRVPVLFRKVIDLLVQSARITEE